MPSDHYPLPHRAAYIWHSAQGKIVLSFPGYGDRKFSQVVLSPDDPQAMATILEVLKARTQEKAPVPGRVMNGLANPQVDPEVQPRVQRFGKDNKPEVSDNDLGF